MRIALIHIVLLGLWLTSCKATGGISSQVLTNTKDSLLYHAKTPYHVSADSLLHFLKPEMEKIYGGIFNKIYIKYEKNLNESFNKQLYAEAYQISQDYLISKLGSYVYAKYVYLYDESFRLPDEDDFHLKFLFYLPTVPREQPSWVDSSLAEILYIFKVKTKGNAIFSIEMPKYVPDCKGLPDCGFVISRDSAIAIAKEAGIIEEVEDYIVDIVPLGEEDPSLVDWIVRVNKINQPGIFITAKINIQTGEVYDKKEWRVVIDEKKY